MNSITKEQIDKLEQIGIAIADSIAEDYDSLKESCLKQKRMVNGLYDNFVQVMNDINKENVK